MKISMKKSKPFPSPYYLLVKHPFSKLKNHNFDTLRKKPTEFFGPVLQDKVMIWLQMIFYQRRKLEVICQFPSILLEKKRKTRKK